MIIKCPYCDIDVDTDDIESEDGCCPECGAVVTASSLFSDEMDEEEDDLDFDDLDGEDEEEEIVDDY